MTFNAYWEQKPSGWRAGKSEDEPKAWNRSLRDVPTRHSLKLHEIDETHITKALEKRLPPWNVMGAIGASGRPYDRERTLPNAGWGNSARNIDRETCGLPQRNCQRADRTAIGLRN
jgi:hypothetical protein